MNVPLYVGCYTLLLYFSRYETVRLKIFSLFIIIFLMYYLCEKYYKSLMIQYYIADCVT